MMDDILTVTTKTTAGQVAVLTVAGEIDHDSRAVLEDAAGVALSEDHVRIVVDLTAVTFCDSGGLNLFVDLHRRTAARGGELRLASLQPPVTAVVRATNLDRLLQLHTTVGEAVDAAERAGR